MFGFGENLCPHCFNKSFTDGKCSSCGFELADSKNNVNCLPQFSILDGRYLLGRCIGAGGFGITYTAYNLKTNTRCAIKEYFPCNVAFRSGGSEAVYCDKEKQYEYSHGLQRFFDEAKTLATLKGEKNIVDILEYIKANNTAYIVMEFIDGVSLKKYMYNRKKVFSYQEAKRIFKDVATALEKVHIKKLLHRDLTPENILIKKDGSVKIVDFGSAKDYVRNATGMSVLVKRGYAPFEQYSSEKQQGPYTDIYSLCCTVYYMLSGQQVPDAPDRINGEKVARLDTFVPGVPKKFAVILEKGMAVLPADRYKSVGEMLADMQGLEQEEKGPAVNPNREHKAVNDLPSVQPQKPVFEHTPAPNPKPQVINKNKTESKGFWHDIKVFLGMAENNRAENTDRAQIETNIFNSSVNRKVQGFNPIYLRIDEGPAAGFVYRITADGLYTIGRSGNQCDAAIEGNNPEISRVHCIITSQNHGTKIFVEDRSANGTYIDRYGRLEQAQQYSIVPGDTLYLAGKKYAMRIVK